MNAFAFLLITYVYVAMMAAMILDYKNEKAFVARAAAIPDPVVPVMRRRPSPVVRFLMRNWRFLLLVTLAVLFVLFIYPSLWQTDVRRDGVMRTNRITGETVGIPGHLRE